MTVFDVSRCTTCCHDCPLVEEMEEILHDRDAEDTTSKSSGRPITFGYTSSGHYLAVVWEHVDDDPLTIYPITAYDAPERKRRGYGS